MNRIQRRRFKSSERVFLGRYRGVVHFILSLGVSGLLFSSAYSIAQEVKPPVSTPAATPSPAPTLKPSAETDEALKPKKRVVIKPTRRPIIRKGGAKKDTPKRISKPKRKKKKVWPKKRLKRALKPSPKLGKIPFPLGERLTYKVNVMNAHAGTVTLKVGNRGVFEGRKVVEISGHIQSSPFLENFYPIRDSLNVLMDEVTFLPVKSEFHLQEKGRDINYLSFYTPETSAIKWRKTKKRKGKVRVYRENYKGPGKIYESLSSLYALRRIPLKAGILFEHYIWDGQRERLIEVHVIGDDRILTDLGWLESTKVEISSVITGGFVSKRLLKRPALKGTAWFAKDPFQTPIKLVTPTKLGTAEAVITHRTTETPTP